jgi:tRNA uridine 5-carboxymethylaminomethyl modification enzyme
LVTDERWDGFVRKEGQKELLTRALENHRHRQWLKRPDSSIREISGWVREVLGEEPVQGVLTTIETETKYEGYIQQQERQMERMKGAGGRPIPADFEFGNSGLSRSSTELGASGRPHWDRQHSGCHAGGGGGAGLLPEPDSCFLSY